MGLRHAHGERSEPESIHPLEVPLGSMVRITRLDIRDTFGQVTTVGPTAPAGEWGMFGLTRPDGSTENALLVAPTLAASLQGRDVEIREIAGLPAEVIAK